MKSSALFAGIQMNWLAVLAGMLCFTFAMVASAEEKKGPCAEDIANFCKDMEKEHVVQCIKDHKRKHDLSPACTQALDEAESYSKIEKNPEFMSACKDDIRELCKSSGPLGSGRMAKCLKDHARDIDASECMDMLK
jgi:hypothetical protein